MDMVLSFASSSVLGTPVWVWFAFHLMIFILLAFDLGVLNRSSREMGIGESLRLSVFYIAIAIAFGVVVWGYLGSQRAIEYYTGYTIEKALSIDNIFVISLIFAYFSIPPAFQYRALVWGIIAVLILRGVMIAAGAALIHQYEWVLYIFGAFLIYTGIKMLSGHDNAPDLDRNPLLAFLRRHMRITEKLHGEAFFVRLPDPASDKKVLYATPLFLALAVINVADIVFAVDSVPAIFAVTTDTCIVYTAYIMAILGLRALYFALAAMVARFKYLSISLALILVLIGVKIFWSGLVAKVDPLLSLAMTLALLGGGIGFSLWKTRSATAKD